MIDLCPIKEERK